MILIILAVIFTIGISDVSAAQVTNVSSDTNFISNNSTVNSSVQLGLKNNQSTVKNTSTNKSTTSKSKTKSPDPQIYNNGVPVARGSYAAGYVFSSIQAAINAAQSGDTIMLEASTFTERITVNKALTFDVFNNGHATIDGSSGGRVVTITVTSGTVTFNDITFTRGSVNDNGAAIYNNNAGTTVNVNNCIFTSNSATGSNHDGGAIYSAGPLYVNSCNFTSNSATGNGGAIWSGSTLTVTNSNFTSNSAANGGAIYNNAGNSNISGSSFTSNSATSNGGAFFNNNGTAEVHFNRFIGGTAYRGSEIRRNGGTVNAQNNWWGSNSSPSGKVSGSRNMNINTWLVLTVNTSSTSIPTSGTATVTADLTHDQNGNYYNPSSGHVPDGTLVTFTLNPSTIGSLSQVSGTTTNGVLTTTFTSGSNSGTATVTAAVDTVSVSTPQITVIRADVYVSPTGSDTTGDGSQSKPYKTIAKGISMVYPGGTVHLLSGTYTGTGNVNVNISSNITIAGENRDSTIIDGQSANRIFIISSGYNVIISNITLKNGLANNDNGGAIQNNGGTLTLNNCAFTSNKATRTGYWDNNDVYGGAIYNTGTLTITNSNFTSNTVTSGSNNYAYGGAIYNSGTLTITGSNFTSNTATTYGGAIINYGTLTITGSNFTSNTAYDGGAISNGDTGTSPTGSLTITGSNFTSNTATSAGGAIWTHGTCNVTGSNFTSNTANNSGGDTAKGSGGAIRNWGTLTVTGSNFTWNSATTNGCAISNYQGTANINFNRIIGNGANDINAEYNGGASTVNAENNWWGSNTGASAGRITSANGASVDANPWIILKINASPTSILVGGTSSVTVDLTWNSNNIQPTGGHVPDGTVSFSGTLGSVNPTSGVMVNGLATTTFTAGNTSGAATVSATLDGVTVSTPITLRPVANLGITQTVNSPVNVGNTVTYTVTVKNNGPNTAHNIRIQDIIPAGFTAVTSLGSYSNGIWAITSLDNGATATLTITGTATSSMAGLTTSNTATELDQAEEYTSPLPTSTAGVYTKKADVALTQTTSSTPVNVGDTVTYTVTATNHGPDTATNINIRDIIPSGLTNVVVTPSAGTTYSNGIWTIPNLINGGIATLTIAGKAGADMAGLTTANTATRTSQTEYNSQAATSTSSGIYVKKADVVITNTASSSKLNVGQTGTFTITVTNNGPDTATNIVINDPLPSGFSASATGGTYSNGIWTINSLASQHSVTLTFTGLITSTMAGTNITNHATETQTEYPPATIADATIHVNKANVAINKAVNGVSKAIVNVGDTITYLITVTNNGPDSATGLQITDLVPSGLSNLAYSASAGTYSLATGLWNIGTLLNSETATLTITGKITAAMAGLNITNYANITAQNEYSSLPVVSAADVYTKLAEIKLNQTATPKANVGDTVTYKVYVTNNGPDTATNMVLSDMPPSSLSNVHVTASIGSYSNGIWTISSLANGETAILTITGTATSSMAGKLVNNTATLTAQTEYDPSTIGDSTTAGVYTNEANVVVSNTANSSSLNVGQTGTFTITVTNNGPDTATNIKINDALPSGFTYSTTGGSYDGSVWTIDSLASEESVTLTFTGVLTASMAGTNITNTATETQTEYPFTVTISDAAIHVKKADVALSQTGSYSGNKVTFVVKATNNGPDSATNINIKDLIPTGLTGVSVTANGGTYDQATGIWTISSLDNGEFATLTITGNATPQTTVTNNATWLNQTEYNSATVTTVKTNVYVPTVNLYVTNYPWYSGVYTYDYKQQMVMLVQVNNLGTTTATGIVVKYVIGSAFKVVSYNLIQPGTLTFDNATNTFTWVIDSLAGGANTYSGSYASFSVLLESLKTGSGGSNFSLNSTITGCDQTNTGTTKTRVRNLIINPSADIQVNQTINNSTPKQGDYVTITIKVKNNGPSTATGVNITDLLPTGLTVDNDPNTSITASQGTYNSTTGLWTIGSLTNSTEVTLTIIARVDAATGTQISNYAYKSGTPAQYDWNTENDANNIIFNVAKTDVNLYVTNYPWYSGVYTYDYKQQMVMLVQVNNLGTTTATGIVVKYVIGSAFKVVSYNLIQPGTLTFDNATNTFTWVIDSLAGGANTYSGSYASFSVLLESLKTGSGGSNFSLNSTITGCDQTNTGTTKTRVRNLIINPSADIQVNQTINNSTPKQGDYVTITIKVKNNGPSTATGVNITDLLPTGLTVDNDPNTSITASQGTYNSTTGLWTIGSLTNSTEVTLTIIARVDAATGTQISNYAYKSGTPAQYDWNTENDAKEINILVS